MGRLKRVRFLLRDYLKILLIDRPPVVDLSKIKCITLRAQAFVLVDLFCRR
jgi:hypothetical protein